MKKRVLVLSVSLIFISVLMVGPYTPKAEAWGWHFHGGPVKDITKIFRLIEEYNRLYSNLISMKKDLDHLIEMNKDTSNMTREYIKKSLERLIMIRNAAKGLTHSYSIIQHQWDETFKGFGAFNGMKASAYADHLKDLDEKTSQALLNAMKAQGIIVELDDDRVILDGLMDSTKSAKGILGAIQVTNYISALQMTQLMRMEIVMTMSFRAQTAYYQWMIQEKMSQRAYANQNQVIFDNPIKSSSSLDIFPEF